ncbi:hypothetical protein [Nonomuraea sp. NPDC050202]|uniref:hypothetical protein n=1 Tax=Nonomuraea sp. NPDC050202 TaxID=3155035 RepID=UPI0033C689D9
MTTNTDAPLTKGQTPPREFREANARARAGYWWEGWDGSPSEYVRRYYRVPAFRGDRVTVYGKPGRITAFRDAGIRVRFDEGPGWSVPCHPVDGVVYVDGDARRAGRKTRSAQ